MQKECLLCDLLPGETGRVVALYTEGGMRRRFIEIGLMEGALVHCVGQSPAGDPCAYLISGAVMAIRRRDARGVSLIRAGVDG